MGDWQRGSSRYQRRQGQGQGQGRGGRGGGGRYGSRDSFRSGRGKPPLPGPPSWETKTPSWDSKVPSWEKDFCYHVGSVSWRRLCEAKAMMPYYKSVTEWDDSACEEAFHEAKARYWEQINGHLSDIPLPNPNMYTDEIDWNPTIDPQLLADLENNYETPSQNDNSSSLRSGWDSHAMIDEGVPCNSSPTGWPESDAKENKHLITPTGWGCWEERNGSKCIQANDHNVCGTGGPSVSPTGWGELDLRENKEHPTPTGWGCWEEPNNSKHLCANNTNDHSTGWGDGIAGDSSWRDISNCNGDGRTWRQWENSQPDTSHHFSKPRKHDRRRDGWRGGVCNPGDSNPINRDNSSWNRRGRGRISYAN